MSNREDMYAQDSIELLQNSGLQFKKHEEEGIDPMDFAELMMTSGVVLMDNVKWLSFHSGYDFGYLLKTLTNHHLPQEESEFFELLRIYFPTIYDVKYLMKSCKNLKGGLQEVADQLELERVGPQHQAGSDSLLTGVAFFKMREVRFFNLFFHSSFAVKFIFPPFWMCSCFSRTISTMPNIAVTSMDWATRLSLTATATMTTGTRPIHLNATSTRLGEKKKERKKNHKKRNKIQQHRNKIACVISSLVSCPPFVPTYVFFFLLQLVFYNFFFLNERFFLFCSLLHKWNEKETFDQQHLHHKHT